MTTGPTVTCHNLSSFLLLMVVDTEMNRCVCMFQFFSKSLITKPVKDDIDLEEHALQPLAELSGPPQPEVMRDDDRTGKRVDLVQEIEGCV